MRRALIAGVVLLGGFGLTSPSAGAGATPNCDGPPANRSPGTAAWYEREQENDYCGEQRFYDTSANPLFLANAALRPGVPEDPFRDPSRWNGVRFRSQQISYTNRKGQRLAGVLFRPCDNSCHGHPATLGRSQPPYPGIVVVHGGAASQEMYLWGSEALAEAGYLVLTFQIPEPDNAAGDTHYANTKEALDYFESTPGQRTAAGDYNPLWRELDRRHVGLTGHSAGGVAVSQLGQEDPRVSAIVSWDRAKSSPMPPGLRIRTPALFLVADFNCQRVPVCIPQPYTSPPNPLGPGNKDEDFQRVRAAGVDTMKIALRAATHLDFTQLVPGTGSRYGAVVATYYTLAWFDRYLRHRDDALGRLVATRFDDSADIHNISGGTFDARGKRNVPAHIAGQPVANRLSFHFRSAYFFAYGRLLCEDMRAGCPPPGLTGSGPLCLPRRLGVSPRRIGPARLGRSYPAFFRRYRALRRSHGATRFCVRGGGRFFVGARRGRIDFVATTARGHRTRHLAPGHRIGRAGSSGASRISRGLFVRHRGHGGRVVYRVRRGRVAFLAVVPRRQAERRHSLLRRLHALRLR